MLEENDIDLNEMLSEIDKDEKKGSFSSMYWKPPKDGRFPIRFIAPLKTYNEKLFYQKHKIHYVNGVPYFCLDQNLKDKNGKLHEACTCPICQKSKQLYNNSSKGTEEWNLAGSLRAKDRYVSRIIVRGNKDGTGADIEAKPVFWEFGTKIFTSILESMKLGECGQFWSMKKGRDYNLVKKGTGRNTSYDGSQISLHETPIFTEREKIEILLKELKDMDYSKLVEFKSEEELKKALNSYLNAEDEEVSVKTAGGSSDPEWDNTVFGVKENKKETVEEPAKETSEDELYPDDISSLLDSI